MRPADVDLTALERRKLGGGLNEFVDNGSARESRTVIVEADSGQALPQRKRARPAVVQIGRLRSASHDLRRRVITSSGMAEMSALGSALKRLSIAAEPIQSARAFVVNVTPATLLKIAKLDEVAAVHPNRSHHVPQA